MQVVCSRSQVVCDRQYIHQVEQVEQVEYEVGSMEQVGSWYVVYNRYQVVGSRQITTLGMLQYVVHGRQYGVCNRYIMEQVVGNWCCVVGSMQYVVCSRSQVVGMYRTVDNMQSMYQILGSRHDIFGSIRKVVISIQEIGSRQSGDSRQQVIGSCIRSQTVGRRPFIGIMQQVFGSVRSGKQVVGRRQQGVVSRKWVVGRVDSMYSVMVVVGCVQQVVGIM